MHEKLTNALSIDIIPLSTKPKGEVKMISAREAHQNTSNAIKNACETRIFKHAIDKLENSIKEAASCGKREICFNTCYFDIRPFSSLQKDEYATAADREAIKSFMEKN